MRIAEDQLEAILGMTRSQLDKGYLPNTLFPYPTWILKWYDTNSTGTMSEDEQEKMRIAKQFISLLPLTTVRRKPGCNLCNLYNRLTTVPADCILDILTVVPDVCSLQRSIHFFFVFGSISF
jgi:hypothetical protein